MDLFQFYDKGTISKEFLLTQDSVYHNEKPYSLFKTVGMFDISDEGVPYGNSLVVHDDLGVFYDSRTTGEIINSSYEENGVGFALTKAFADFFDIKRNLPLVHGQAAFMPLAGASRKNRDWASLHYVDRFQVDNNKAIFTTSQNYEIEFDFSRGNLEKQVHNASILSLASIILFHWYLKPAFYELKPLHGLGQLLKNYANCTCEFHVNIQKRMRDIHSITVWIKNFIYRHFGFEIFERDELIKEIDRNLYRIKKLY